MITARADKSAFPFYRRIQCLGDSITHGSGSRDTSGYRPYLFNALASSTLVTSNGTQQSTSSYTLPDYLRHDGYDGYVPIAFSGHPGLDSRIGAMYPTVTPDLVILLNGVNALYYGKTPAQAVADLASLRALIRAAGVWAHILCVSLTPTISPFTVPDSAVQTANGLLQTSLIGETNVSFVDVHTAMLPDIATKLVGDGVHPNDVGYAQLGALLAAKVATLPIFS